MTSRRCFRPGARNRRPRAQPASIRRAGGRRDRDASRRGGRDADRRGKTLAAVMPAALNALDGRGVHVLTFNDYLARSRRRVMGLIYARLGLSVGFVQAGMRGRTAPRLPRRRHLRDRQGGRLRSSARPAGDGCFGPGSPAVPFARSSRGGLAPHRRSQFRSSSPAASAATALRRACWRILATLACVDFDCDEITRVTSSSLKPESSHPNRAPMRQPLRRQELHAPDRVELRAARPRAPSPRCRLPRARRPHRIIDSSPDGVVRIVTGPTGCRRRSKQKEGLERQPDGRILGRSITLQHFLGSYPRLCGMTGTRTGRPGSRSYELHGSRSSSFLPHRPMIRRSARRSSSPTGRRGARRRRGDRVVHASGRPVLVGTIGGRVRTSGAAARSRAGRVPVC